MATQVVIGTMKCNAESGAALLTALVFLVILTLLGVGVFTTSTSEEVMARNFRDKEIALQAADAAVNEAKMLITANYNATQAPTTLTQRSCYASPIAGFNCDAGLDLNNYDLYDKNAGAEVGTISSADTPALAGFSAGGAPRYLVVRQLPAKCGIQPTDGVSRDCFYILAEAKGRLANTRVKVLEIFVN